MIKCVALLLSICISSVLSSGAIKLISPDGLVVTTDQVKSFMISKGAKEIHTTSIVKSYDGETNIFDSAFGLKFGPGNENIF